ncbi:hypothetical protein [Lysobacter gummosus]
MRECPAPGARPGAQGAAAMARPRAATRSTERWPSGLRQRS